MGMKYALRIQNQPKALLGRPRTELCIRLTCLTFKTCGGNEEPGNAADGVTLNVEETLRSGCGADNRGHDWFAAGQRFKVDSAPRFHM